ncbi:MAG TPA: UbiA family prenyltransferase [Chthoniobacteraceae bacterium]|nr:UbiA family prenyltransferase [Chthoniobacteraceae bacterium]
MTPAQPTAAAHPDCSVRSPWLLLLHYWLPLGLGWSLAMVMQHRSGAAFSAEGLTLLLGGIGSAYSLDRLLDRPASGYPRWLWWTLCIGFAGFGGATAWAMLRMPLLTVEVAGLLALATLAYPWLKRFPLLKTVTVALAWTSAAALFPFCQPGAWTETSLRNSFPWDVTLPLFLLLAAACVLCDLKDLEEDRLKAVFSLPNLCGIAWACRIAAALALAGSFLASWNGRLALLVAGGLLALLAQFPSLLRRKAIGPMMVDAVLIVPGVLLLLGGGV